MSNQETLLGIHEEVTTTNKGVDSTTWRISCLVFTVLIAQVILSRKVDTDFNAKIIVFIFAISLFLSCITCVVANFLGEVLHYLFSDKNKEEHEKDLKKIISQINIPQVDKDFLWSFISDPDDLVAIRERIKEGGTPTNALRSTLEKKFESRFRFKIITSILVFFVILLANWLI